MSTRKQFRTGLCDCCEHPSSCVDVACCFPCQVARQKQITLGLAVGAAKKEPTGCEQFCLCVSLFVALPIAFPILGGIARTYVYKGYGVEESCTCCCDNCCNVGCVCPCCSLCQTYREHALRGNCSSTSMTLGGSPYVLPPKPTPIPVEPKPIRPNVVAPIFVAPNFVEQLYDSITAQSSLEWKKMYETRYMMNDVTSNAQRVNSPLVATKVAWFFAMLCQDSSECRAMASNKEVYSILIQRCCNFATSTDCVLWIGNAIGNIVASNQLGRNFFSTSEAAMSLRNIMKYANDSDTIEFLCYCIRGIVTNNDEGAKIYADTPNFVGELKKLQAHAMTPSCREEYDGCLQMFSRFASSQLLGQLKEQGYSALARERYADAVNYFTSAININQNDKDLYSNRSAAYCGINDFTKAKEDAEMCIFRDSAWYHGYFLLGAALQGAKEPESALPQFEKALTLAPYDKKEAIRLRIVEVNADIKAAKKKKLKPDPKIGSASLDLPVAGPFKRVKELPFEEALRALLTLLKQPPHGFEYLADMIPDLEDADSVINYINGIMDQLKKRPQIVEYQNNNGLTDDEVRALHAYKLEDPYPVYRWLNAWLMCSRRDDNVKKAVGPFFIILNRAMSKLPKVKSSASRAIMVRNIPALRSTFDHHKERCAPGEKLSFWGFASFSTDDDVINSPQFMGDTDEQAIIFSCGSLEGVDMEPFAPSGMKEKEVLPMCPTIFEVQTAVMVGVKLTIAVKQLDNNAFAYVRNDAASTSASGVYPTVG